MKKGIWVAGIIIALLIYFGPSQLEKWDTKNNEEAIAIGFIGPLTGDAVSYGEPISNAVRLAVDEINATGGVKGKMIEIIYEDGKCTSKDAINATQKLVNVDKVDIIIGGICSGETLAMLPITEPAGVLVLSPSASSPDLTGAGEFFFRNNPSDDSGGTFLAGLMSEYSKVAIISEETDYAGALRKVFIESFEAGGGNVVADESFAPKTGDFRSILTKIKAAEPEAIVINPQTEIAGGTIAKQAKELEITADLYGSNILSGSKAIEIGGENLEGIVLFDSPGLNPENPRAVAFLKNYEEKYGELSIEFYLGAAYDNVYILAEAIGVVGTDTEMLRKYLNNMRMFKGVIGTYEFDENGDLAGIKHVAKKVQNGEVITIE